MSADGWRRSGRRVALENMPRILAAICVSPLLMASFAASAPRADAGAGADELAGRWRNPEDSVHIVIRPCGASGSCGYVVWASEKAKADARRGGTARLVGLELFRGLVRERDGLWRGAVFVPDLNGTFSGTAQRLGSGRFRATGCLLPAVLCQSQIWTQVEEAAPSAPG